MTPNLDNLPKSFLRVLVGFVWVSCLGGAMLRAQTGLEENAAIKRLKVAEGLQVKVFSAEPDFVNPTNFFVDAQGRFFVVETHRYRTSAYSMEHHMEWVWDDLACRTVEDRIAMCRKYMGEDVRELAVESERIRFVEDRDGDGRADHAVTFAEGFNTIADGTAAGVLAHQGSVWFTNIPNLWLLRDTNADGKADVRKAVHTGFGVRFAYTGHDLHGLCLGPDGKLYFSMGDRGLHVETEGRVVSAPDMGSVLRCNLDGSDLEFFAVGVRNPQELAFDKYGNLWTGDNDADIGDRSRLVYVMEGGDSGWRIGYQHMPGGGPWITEQLWQRDAPAPYLVPPVGYVANGSAGLAYYPGTGLPDRYKDHFLLCDYPGGIHSFAVEPKGAGFELVDPQRFLWNLLPTDVTFGPAGGVFALDWVGRPEGVWGQSSRGRIYHLFDPEIQRSVLVQETKRFLAEGMGKRSPKQLGGLLGHQDQRVRQAAQFELAARGESVAAALAGRAADGPLLGRLHAIWALGMIGGGGLDPVVQLLGDPQTEVRAQAARVLGDHRRGDAYEGLLALLNDPSLRVRGFAAMALGKLGQSAAIGPILEMLRANGDRDPYLRHAGVMGLVWIGDDGPLVRAATDESVSVRLAALLALRRLEHTEVARFLRDHDPALVFEAARAINDVPIQGAFDELAALISEPSCPPQALSRVINVNFRLGTAGSAAALSAFAQGAQRPAAMRAEAIETLADWARPASPDRVVGLWRPLAPRNPAVAREALRTGLEALVHDASEQVQVAAIRAVGALEIRRLIPVLREKLSNRSGASALRVEAMRSLEKLNDPFVKDSILVLLEDTDHKVRAEMVSTLLQFDLPDRAAKLERLIAKVQSLPDRQAALAVLGDLKEKKADHVLQRYLDQMLVGEFPAELRLDLVAAAGKRSSPAVRERLERLADTRDPANPLSPYTDVLVGGDRKAGGKIFYENKAVACARCHRIKRRGGTVGPELTQIAANRDRMALLESILVPNRQITEGYGQEMLILTDETFETGRIEQESDQEVVLILPSGATRRIDSSLIDSRKHTLSAMPEGLHEALSKHELRDLIEFLASLK